MVDEKNNVIDKETITNEESFEVLDATATLENTNSLYFYIYGNLIKICCAAGAILLAVALGLRIFMTVSSIALFLSGFLALAYSLLLVLLAKINAKKSYEKSLGAEEKWYIYSDYIVYRVIREGTEKFMLRIDANKLSELKVLNDVYAFKYENMAFCIPKEKVEENGALFKLLQPNGEIKHENSKNMLVDLYRFLNIVSCVFAVICVLTIENSYAPWRLLTGAVLALICLVLSGIAQGKGIKIKGSVFANIVAVLIFLIFSLAALGLLC